MRLIIITLLHFFSVRIVKWYKPKIIGITGSVGKTSAKEAIALALKNRVRVRSSAKNYNNEFGVPLTIIGATESPGRSLWGWFVVLLRAVYLLLSVDPAYPKILVLEMGSDRPGDIEVLTRIAPCTIGVITAIGPAHLEKFGSMEALVNEKKQMIRSLTSGATAVVNCDDPFLYPVEEGIRARVMTFGFSKNADVRVVSLIEKYDFSPNEHEQLGVSFECTFQGQSCDIELRGAIGRQSVYAVLAGIAVTCALDIPLHQAVQDMREYKGEKGRMRTLRGLKKTLIIDDTYNSSPIAVCEALSVLEKITIDEQARRIAVLGDMLELGAYSEQEHRKIGTLCVEKRIDILIAVGVAAKWIADGVEEVGIDKMNIFRFDKAEEVGDMLCNILRQGDVVLVKGSQGVRLEKIVKEIMAEPERAEELLVRQGKEWQ